MAAPSPDVFTECGNLPHRYLLTGTHSGLNAPVMLTVSPQITLHESDIRAAGCCPLNCILQQQAGTTQLFYRPAYVFQNGKGTQ